MPDGCLPACCGVYSGWGRPLCPLGTRRVGRRAVAQVWPASCVGFRSARSATRFAMGPSSGRGRGQTASASPGSARGSTTDPHCCALPLPCGAAAMLHTCSLLRAATTRATQWRRLRMPPCSTRCQRPHCTAPGDARDSPRRVGRPGPDGRRRCMRAHVRAGGWRGGRCLQHGAPHAPPARHRAVPHPNSPPTVSREAPPPRPPKRSSQFHTSSQASATAPGEEADEWSKGCPGGWPGGGQPLRVVQQQRRCNRCGSRGAGPGQPTGLAGGAVCRFKVRKRRRAAAG